MIVKFSSKTCAPCKQLDVILKDLGNTSVIHRSIENDRNEAIASNIRSVPTLIKYDDSTGEEIARMVGLKSIPEIKEFLN